MERNSNKITSSVNQDDFQNNGNDSDLEGRLYAEIYYSNEVHETGENFEDNCLKTIQEIKNSSSSSIQSTSKPILNNLSENIESQSNSVEKNCLVNNDQANLGSADNGEQFSDQIDKNLNLEKPVNLEAESDNISGGISNEIVKNLNLQEKPDRNLNSQRKGPKPQKNKTEIIIDSTESYSPSWKNGQKQKNLKKKKVSNNSLTTPKSMKRASTIEKDSGGKSKKRSLESDRRANLESNEVQLNPISLNGRKSWNEANDLPLFSNGAMDLLFSDGWKGDKRKDSVVKKAKGGDQKRLKANKVKENANVNKKPILKSSQQVREDEIIEISSSDSSNDYLDLGLSCTVTPQIERRKQNEGNEKQMPKWLDVSSDSSDESILEVPVPPKPPPPLVVVKDTDGDSSDIDDSSSDGIYDLKSTNSKTKQEKVFSSDSSSDDSEENSEAHSRGNSKGNPRENSKVSFVESSDVISVESSEDNSRPRHFSEQSNLINETSDSSYSDFPVDERIDDSIRENLILNCTEVQKGASSLEEIKKIGRASVSSGVEKEAYEIVNETSTEYNEFFEPLKDAGEDLEPEFLNPGPSTSKATGASAENKKSHTKQKTAKIHKSSKEKTDDEYFFEPMLNKVKAFYDNSWGGEEFSVEETQKKMSKDPRRWAILDEDWKPSLLKRQRYFLSKTKCSLCQQSGHLRANCPEPKKGPVCHMCGSAGHYETRCPHKICLTCGKKQNSFRKTCESCEKLFCTLCRSRGHKKDTCPDLWRQYHHTTSETEHQPPKNSSEVMKPSNLLICCNCTMRGHDYTTCKRYRWSQHYPTPSYVTSYNICNQATPSTSRNCVEVVNLVESSGESCQSVKKDTEPKSVTEEENFQIPENDHNTDSNSKSDKVKILFEHKIKKPPKVRKRSTASFNRKHKVRIVLSDMEGANLEGLIAGRTSFMFLIQLSNILRSDFCITLAENSKVELTVTFYRLFSQRYVYEKILYHWVRLSDEDRKDEMFPRLRMAKKELIRVLSNKFDELDNEKGSIKDLYNSVKKMTRFLKQHEDKSMTKVYLDKKKELITTRHKLVMLLYKYDCALNEKEALSKFRKMFNTLKGKETVSSDTSIWIFYYYHLIFGLYTPPDLEKMVNKYLALNDDKADRPLNNSDLSNNQDQENLNQEHVEQDFFLNKSASSIPSLLEINPPSFPQQFYQGESPFAAGSSNTPPKPNRHFHTFSSPAQDFIPISNNEFNQVSPKFKKKDRLKKRNRKQNGRNPVHNFKKFNPTVPQTNERFRQDATFLMHQALKMNLLHVTKAAIRVGDLINENKLQSKHVRHLKHLISQQRRGVR